MLSNKFFGKESKIVFALVFLIILPSFFLRCSVFANLNFDSQAFLTWLFTGEKNYLPYRDVFYPYGLYFFFKQTNNFLFLIDLVIKSSLFVFYYYIFKTLFYKKIFLYTAFGFFILFISLITGLDTFLRYGLLVAFSVFLFLSYHNNLLIKNRINVFLGIFGGIVFCLLSDQGMYAFIIYFSLQGYFLIKNKAKKTFNQLLLFIVGAFFIIFPFLLALKVAGLMSSYVNSFTEYRSIALLAKIPFPPSLISVDNLFTISLLTAVISVLSYKAFVLRKKITSSDAIGVGLVVSLFLLEQKNVARSIDLQLTFLGFILFCYLVAPYSNKLKIRKIFLPFVAVCFFLIFIVGFKTSTLFLKNNWGIDAISSSSCISYNLNYKERAKTYFRVFNQISKYQGKKNIFSFPQDPIFYILFDQKPPYYFSVYESSYGDGQKRILQYLNATTPEYVIINGNSIAIQDGVPDAVRGKDVLSYILKNYIFSEKVDNFLILKKSKSDNYFNAKGWDNDYSHRVLLNVNLGAIPAIEARDKEKYLSQRLVQFEDPTSFNQYMLKKQLNSKDKFILFKTRTKQQLQINIRTKVGLTSRLLMTNCANYCLIHLDNLPMLYSPKVINSIEFEPKEVFDIQLFESKDSIFW